VIEHRQDSDIKPTLTLDKDIEITNSITFCIRFYLKGTTTLKYIFISQNEEIALRFPFVPSYTGGLGFIHLNREILIFKIPKTGIDPFNWHHLCFNSDEKSYKVVADGLIWHEAEHKKTNNRTFSKTSQIRFGSTYENLTHFSGYQDYTGDLSELNIWGKALSEEEMIDMTQNCGKVHPPPDILNWSEIENSIKELTGKNHTKPVERLCNSYGNGAIRQVLPIRWSTCVLDGFSWLLDQEIFLKQRKE
jgi:hypothetical protein